MTDEVHHIEFGAGVPVIVIHGYTVDHRVMLPLERAFDELPGFRRIYLDLPGHGASPRLPGPTTATAVVDAVCERIRELIGDAPFAVVGQSFGGQVARAVTARFGEQVLGSALIVPLVKWRTDRTLPTVTTLLRDDALLAGLPESSRTMFTLVTAHQDAVQWARFREFVLPGLEAYDRAAAAELDSAFMLPMPELTVPPHPGRHLLVVARQDGLVGWRDQLELLDHYPRMTAVVLDGAGHNPQVEAPEVTARYVADWLRELQD